MTLNTENARAFNNSLKKAAEAATGLKLKVRIINSCNFPKCYIEIRTGDIDISIPNEFRLKVFDTCHLDRSGLLNPENVNYGNIRKSDIAIYPTDWERVFAAPVTNQIN